MPFPLDEKYIFETEQELGILFPDNFKAKMIQENGGELMTEDDDWQFIPFFESYEIRFMLAPTDKRRDGLEDIFAEIFTDLKNRRSENFSKKQYQVIKITDSIINEQRKKIVDLDNSNPIL